MAVKTPEFGAFPPVLQGGTIEMVIGIGGQGSIDAGIADMRAERVELPLSRKRSPNFVGKQLVELSSFAVAASGSGLRHTIRS